MTKALHAAAHTALMQAEPLPLPDFAAGGAPEWLHLLPAGDIHTVDGRGPYPAADLADLAERSMQAAGGRMPLDENHSTDLAAPLGGASPARGWIDALEARADGLWGHVEWTEDGRRLVEGKAYRHISPVITHARDKRITGILRASLVNRPNMRGLAALHGEQTMDFFEKLRLQLGLGDDADEAAAIAAVEGLQTSMSTHAAELGALAKAAGVEGEEISVVLNAVQEHVDPTKFVPIADVIALQQELAGVAQDRIELQAETSLAKAKAFVEGAIAVGKIGVKPLKEHYIARHMAEPEVVEREIGAFPALHAASKAKATPPEQAPGDKPASVTADELATVELMGIDPAAYTATKAALGKTEAAL